MTHATSEFATTRVRRSDWTKLDHYSDTMEIPLAFVFQGLIAGAIATGQLHRLVSLGLRGVHYPRRSTRNPLRWERETVGDFDPRKAGVYRYGDWRLHREGVVGGHSARRTEGVDGWFLTGPGIDGKLWLSMNRPEAQQTATGIIRGIEAEMDEAAMLAEHSGVDPGVPEQPGVDSPGEAHGGQTPA